MTKKILMLVGDFVEDYEVIVPFQTLQIAGHEVYVICPGKKAGEQVRTAVHDMEGDQTYTEKHGHNFTLNATFDEINVAEFDALIIPGGRAPEYLRLNHDLLDIVKHFSKTNKPIASVCHGAQILAAADVIKGRKIAGLYLVEPEIRAAGGEFVKVSLDQAITDGNLITAPAWASHVEWLRQFLNVLNTK
jgi:protease I